MRKPHETEHALAVASLPEDAAARLILAFADTRGARGLPFTEEEATKLVEWARLVRLENALLGMVLDGDVGIDWTEDGYVVTSWEAIQKAKEKRHAQSDTLPANAGPDLPATCVQQREGDAGDGPVRPKVGKRRRRHQS